MASLGEPRRIGYVPAFDGLRGITLVIIMIGHMTVFWNLGRLLVIPGAFIALDSFFVLSGFLITALLLKEYDATGRVRFAQFYGRRAVRLLPALTVLLSANLLYSVTVGYPPGTPAGFEGNMLLAVALYFWNWRIALTPGSFLWPADLKHLWSLSIEEQFYFVWPLAVGLVFTLRRRLRLNVAVIGGLIVAVAVHRTMLLRSGHSGYELYHRTDTRADALLIGALLAQLWARGLSIPRRILVPTAWVSLAFLAICLVVFQPFQEHLYRYSIFSFIGLAWAVVILATVEGVWPVNRFLELRPLRALGELSYGIYLWHLMIYFMVKRANLTVPVPAQVALALALTALAASASWLLVERPFLRLKSRLGTATIAGEAPQPVAVHE